MGLSTTKSYFPLNILVQWHLGQLIQSLSTSKTIYLSFLIYGNNYLMFILIVEIFINYYLYGGSERGSKIYDIIF